MGLEKPGHDSVRELLITDPAVLDAAAEAFASPRPVFLLQLPTVFALVAPPSALGVRCLDEAKQRLPEKTYGSAVGAAEAFHAMALPTALPEFLDAAAKLEIFQGAFVRIAIGQAQEASPTVHGGTHQGLLLGGPHRELFVALERSCLGTIEPTLFCGHAYAAPLCTSANLSGDPLGSITTWPRARAFALERNIDLVVRAEASASGSGSYPIFNLSRNRIRIERHGPLEAEIRARLPTHLFEGAR
jgi:tRNA A37 threonylcarbamoyladenosine synthetase subunit TsaC/SUA5/YrdC